MINILMIAPRSFEASNGLVALIREYARGDSRMALSVEPSPRFPQWAIPIFGAIFEIGRSRPRSSNPCSAIVCSLFSHFPWSRPVGITRRVVVVV